MEEEKGNDGGSQEGMKGTSPTTTTTVNIIIIIIIGLFGEEEVRDRALESEESGNQDSGGVMG